MIAEPRVLENEAMATIKEVRAYDGLVQKYMNILHAGFVETVLNLGPVRGKALEVGTGTGRISIELARNNPDFTVWAIDLSEPMLQVGRENEQQAGVMGRVHFTRGDAKRLPFPDRTFDLVFSHNMMHHLPEPIQMVKDMVRVLKPDGGFFLRDLFRQTSWIRRLHVTVFGATYDPIMKRQYNDSIRAALSRPEWEKLFRSLPLKGAKLKRQFLTHLSIERPSLDHRTRRFSVQVPLHQRIPKRLYSSR